MQKILWIVGSTIGSSVGWWLGSYFGMTGSFIVSTIGMAAGTYYGFQLGKKLNDD